MRGGYQLALGVLVLGAYSDHRAGRATLDAGLPDAGAPADARAIDSGLPGYRTLDSLDAREARAFCEEDARRSDPCAELGIKLTDTQEACEAQVADCRANLGEVSTLGCDGVSFGAPGECTTTIDEYFACAAAWNASLTCAEPAFLVEAPAACDTVVRRCPRLAGTFFIPGKPRPCTPEESAGNPVRDEDDIYGLDPCRPRPARFVILGDSIADCTGVESTADCAPYLIAARIRDTVPELEVETYARAGARIADVEGQARAVPTGSGHVFVWIYAIGNDLLGGNLDAGSLAAGYGRIFDVFTDTARYPDGVTFLLNTQYVLWDDCSAPGAFSGYTPELAALIQDINRKVFLDVAESRDDAVAIDQYPDFLGHGANADVHGCPHCGADNTPWVPDHLHPNVPGNAHIAEKWYRALPAILATDCR